MATTVPSEWLSNCKMSRVVCHWTAGAHLANSTDREAYHILVEGSGALVRGDHEISDNVDTSSDYAAHTKGLNTGSIGVSMCCMAQATENPFYAGPYPMTESQWRKMVLAVADLCAFYKIAVTPQTVLSHAEVEANLNVDQSGKWDFTRLAFALELKGAKVCGDKLRKEVSSALAGEPAPAPGADIAAALAALDRAEAALSNAQGEIDAARAALS